MSVILRGNTSLQLQSDQTVKQFADGSGEAHLSYKCPWDQLSTFLPTPLQPHPVFDSLLLYEFEIAKEPGEIGRYDCTFKGVLAEEPELLAQYDVSITTSSEPIETNPKFAFPPASPPVSPADLRKINQALENNSQTSPAIDPAGAAFQLYLRKLRGIDSYLRVGTVFRKSFVAVNPPVGQYSAVGVIVDIADDNAPVAPKGQNYIATGVIWRKQAGVVYVTEEATLSGLGGWDEYLYTAPL